LRCARNDFSASKIQKKSPVPADLKFALRSLAKSPGFTAVALLTLALGIGVNTSMFSVLEALMFRTPYPDDTRLVRIYRTSPQSRQWPHSAANFLDHRAQAQSFERIAANSWASYNLAEPGQPAEQLRGLNVTADFFPLLGVQPEAGRFFTSDEDAPGKNRVIVISHATWLQRFGGARDAIGRTLRIDGEPVTVIGVMPARFDHRLRWGRIDAWRPIALSDAARQDRGNNYLHEIARLKPGVTLAQAQAEMDALAARLAAAYPQNNAQNGLRLVPFARSGDDFGSRLTWFVVGLAGFVLLIACANLANLQFARHASHAREQAIRAALGASRVRLMRGVLAESLVLALAGGALGLLVALWSNDAIGTRLMISDLSGLAIPLDWRALAFTFAASSATGLAFGALPAWFSSRADVNATLKQGGRGTTAGRATHRVRHALIVTEFGLALVLLAGAGFFLRGLDRFLQRDAGWRVDGLVTGHINLVGKNYSTADQRRAFHERLAERMATLPGVDRAALSTGMPTWGFGSSSNFLIEHQARPAGGSEPLATEAWITPGYFETLGLPLLQGRDFATTDRADTPDVVIINETMARTFWPGENPLGKRLGAIDPKRPGWRVVVGIVRDAEVTGYFGADDTRFQAYRPLAQAPAAYLTVVMRTPLAPEAVALELRRAVAAIDPDQPVYQVDSVHREIDRALSGSRLAGAVLTGFALLGLLLAGVGIYGVIAQSVVERTNEIGVRLALGAQLHDVLALVLGHGLRLAVLGAAFGLAGAFGIARLLRAIAPGMPPAEPGTAASVTIGLLAVAALACWLPARRAAKIDPIVALRAE